MTCFPFSKSRDAHSHGGRHQLFHPQPPLAATAPFFFSARYPSYYATLPHA